MQYTDSCPWLTCFNPGISATLGLCHWLCCRRWCRGLRRHCFFSPNLLSALYCYTRDILHTALKLHDMSRFKRRRNEEHLFHETVASNCKYEKFVTQVETHMTVFQLNRFTEGSWGITTRFVCTLIHQFVKNLVIYNITCVFTYSLLHRNCTTN